MLIRCLTCLKKNRMKKLLFIANAIGLVTLASLSGCSNQVDEIEVGEILAETARKVGGYTYSVSSTHPYGTWNTEMGYGLLDAYAAVQEAKARLN